MHIQIPDPLADRAEEVAEQAGYATPSELIRDAVRHRVEELEQQMNDPVALLDPSDDERAKELTEALAEEIQSAHGIDVDEDEIRVWEMGDGTVEASPPRSVGKALARIDVENNE